MIDLVIFGENINLNELERVRGKTEKLINRKISVLTLEKSEYSKLRKNFEKNEIFILFKGNG